MRMRLILYSTDDTAGANIARMLSDRHGYEKTGEKINGMPVCAKGETLLIGSQTNVKDLSEFPLKPDVCIVASRHRSESGQPTLTCHPTGNFGKAELGGKESKLQTTEARYLSQSLKNLKKAKEKYDLGYDVTMEVTHHGPTDLPFPLLYVEVGSTPTQWNDENACNAAAEAINETISAPPEDKPATIGFGGPHYAPNFNKVAENYAIGHIMPKHATQNLTKTMVQQMIEKTVPRPETAIIDWKGLKGAERETLLDILKEVGLKPAKTSELK